MINTKNGDNKPIISDRHRCCELSQSTVKDCYLKMSAARRRKSCSCWSLSELIPLSMMLRKGSTKPSTRGLPACRATNSSMRSNTYKSQVKEGDMRWWNVYVFFWWHDARTDRGGLTFILNSRTSVFSFFSFVFSSFLAWVFFFCSENSADRLLSSSIMASSSISSSLQPSSSVAWTTKRRTYVTNNMPSTRCHTHIWS